MSEILQGLQEFIARQGVAILLPAAAVLLYLLTRFADVAVDGAVSLARVVGVPPVIIGATVVSLGTTLPEVAVSVVAAAGGDSAMAVGNATGSIVANIGLIAATLLLLTRRRVHGRLVLPSALIALAAVVALAAVALITSAVAGSDSGSIPRVTGIVCLVVLPIYLFLAFRTSGAGPLSKPGPEAARDPGSGRATTPAMRPVAGSLVRVVLGTAVVVLSSRILLPIVVELSRRVGLPESLIAATLVAVGTSLPELSTAIAAARRGEIEMGLGNVAGANLINVLLVVGLSAVVSGSGLAVDFYLLRRMIPAAVVFSSALVAYLVAGRGSRLAGGIMLAGYAALVATGIAGGG